MPNILQRVKSRFKKVRFDLLPKIAFPVAKMVKAAGVVNKSSLKQRRHKFESDEEIILYYFLSASFAVCCKLMTQLTS